MTEMKDAVMVDEVEDARDGHYPPTRGDSRCCDQDAWGMMLFK